MTKKKPLKKLIGNTIKKEPVIDNLISQSEGKTYKTGVAGISSLKTIKGADTLPKEYTKAGEHLVRQTLGKSPNPKQMSLFDLADRDQDNKDYIEKHGINEIGASLTISGRKALHAMQTLYSNTNYEGNQRGGKLRITVSDFLEAYGVGKRTAKNGYAVYNRAERDSAMKALKELQEPRVFHYSKLREQKDKGKKSETRYDMVLRKEPIIYIIATGYQDISGAERKEIIQDANKGETNLKGKTTHLEIRVSEIFIDQVERYFILLPKNLPKMITSKLGKVSAALYCFIDYLHLQAKRRRYDFKIDYENLVYTLRLGKYLEQKRKAYLRKSLETCFADAKSLGLLKSVEINGLGMVYLTLDENGFYKKGDALENKTPQGLLE